MRSDGRAPLEVRKVSVTPHVNEYAEGSCLIHWGKTQILCTASYEQPAPKWVQGTGGGWVTAEYGMLPRSTQDRMKREKTFSSGRSQEISRLIGRSLRAAVDLTKLPDCQITIDCDVLHADGGTRTAAITGGYVALCLALRKLWDVGEVKDWPIQTQIAAISVGLKNGEVLLDLNYEEDASIDTDMNFVMDSDGRLIEIQGTAEKAPFTRNEFTAMWEAASLGIRVLFERQNEVISSLIPSR